jgi:hypothetical protein
VAAALIGVLSLRRTASVVDILQFAAMFPGLFVAGMLARAGIPFSAFVCVVISYLIWTTVVLLVALLLRRRARGWLLLIGGILLIALSAGSFRGGGWFLFASIVDVVGGTIMIAAGVGTVSRRRTSQLES